MTTSQTAEDLFKKPKYVLILTIKRHSYFPDPKRQSRGRTAFLRRLSRGGGRKWVRHVEQAEGDRGGTKAAERGTV